MNETLQLFFTIAASVFDMIIAMIYLNVLFKQPKDWVSKPIYLISFIGIYVLFWFLRGLSDNWLVFVFITLLETFILTMLYNEKIIIKVFAAVSLQVFSMISEVVSNSVINSALLINNKEILPDEINLYTVMLSKLLKFIIVIVILLIMKRTVLKANIKDYFCLIVIPLFSMFIIVALTLESDGQVRTGVTSVTSILGMLIINFIVYYLLNNIIKSHEIKEKQTQMETQFMFQEKKYEQTSMSFKSISSILHDTNKHLLYLRECAEQRNFEDAISYIDDATNHVSNSYKRINTGFLVIDALVSNAFNTADANKINFKTDIKINKDNINIERYDLSVALGNLLDNAIEACVKIRNLDDRFIKVNIFTTDTALAVNIKNSINVNNKTKNFKSDKQDNISHGYGLGNVNAISEKYGGSFLIEKNQSNVETTLILPLKD